MNEDLFGTAMAGIGQKVAMQEIRKVIRGSKPEGVKLELIVNIVHAYDDYVENAELEAERKAIQAEEAEAQREKIDQMFDDMAKPLDQLTIRERGKNDKG